MAIIAWSGGLDSSLLVKWAHDYYFKKESAWTWMQNDKLTEYDCKVHGIPTLLNISFNQLNSDLSVKQDLARSKIKEFLDLRFDEKNIKINWDHYESLGLPQATLWITQMFLCLKDNEALFVGWNRDDDAAFNIDRIHKVWDALCLLNSKKCYLFTPLIELRKTQIITQCKTAGILDLCWWCEIPAKNGDELVPCGNCKPCKLMINSNINLAIEGSSKIYQEKLDILLSRKDELKDKLEEQNKPSLAELGLQTVSGS